MSIKVLGGCCSKCETLLKNVKEAVANKQIDAKIEYITDFSIIASLGILQTPALMIDDKVVATGRVLKPKQIEKFL